MSFYIKYWGTRGSIPTPGKATRHYGGNTSCVEIRAGHTLFICDGGTGLRELGQDLLQSTVGPIVGHMLFSHSHWDHIQGFPFFTPAYIGGNTFHIYSPEAGDRRMYDLLSGQMRSEYFPVNFADLDAKVVASDLPAQETGIEGVKINVLLQTHPGGSYAFSFETDTTKIVYATDTEFDLCLLNREESLQDLSAIRQMPPEYVEFAKGADLLIADSQYYDSEYSERIGWGHPRANTTVDWAVQAGVKHLALFHHDPMHSDADVDRKIDMCQARAQAQSASLVISGAQEGDGFRV